MLGSVSYGVEMRRRAKPQVELGSCWRAKRAEEFPTFSKMLKTMLQIFEKKVTMSVIKENDVNISNY